MSHILVSPVAACCCRPFATHEIVSFVRIKESKQVLYDFQHSYNTLLTKSASRIVLSIVRNPNKREKSFWL